MAGEPGKEGELIRLMFASDDPLASACEFWQVITHYMGQIGVSTLSDGPDNNSKGKPIERTNYFDGAVVIIRTSDSTSKEMSTDWVKVDIGHNEDIRSLTGSKNKF